MEKTGQVCADRLESGVRGGGEKGRSRLGVTAGLRGLVTEQEGRVSPLFETRSLSETVESKCRDCSE